MIRAKSPIPLISVIVPVFNTEKYLKRCITSIQNQTYKNLEIICVDDGSTDRSNIILEELKKNDNRLCIVHTQNKGVSNARNVALSLSSGELISFIDSDDYIEPSMYEIMVQKMDCPEIDIVTCSYSMVNNDKKVKMVNESRVPEGPINSIDFLEYVYERDSYKGVGGYIWTRLFKRNLIIDECNNKLLVKFDTKLAFGEDIIFVAETSLRAKKILYIDDGLYNYVRHKESATYNRDGQLKTMGWIYAYESIIKIYERNNIPNIIINLVKRMYVYRCGKTLEIALESGCKEKCDILRKKIKENLLLYIESNINYLDRIQWIIALLQTD